MFEYEKGRNIEKVEQLKAKEKDLIGMAREMEKLQAEVKNSERRVHGNFSCAYAWFYWLKFYYSDSSSLL